MNRPRWRWVLFCAVDSLTLRVKWAWLARLWAWCILPEWLASEEELADMSASSGKEDPW